MLKLVKSGKQMTVPGKSVLVQFDLNVVKDNQIHLSEVQYQTIFDNSSIDKEEVQDI